MQRLGTSPGGCRAEGCEQLLGFLGVAVAGLGMPSAPGNVDVHGGQPEQALNRALRPPHALHLVQWDQHSASLQATGRGGNVVSLCQTPRDR